MTTEPEKQEVETEAFNPNKHLMDISNKKYLPVMWRLVWFREQCPQGTIETEELAYDLDREITIEKTVWNKDKKKSEVVTKTAKGYARYHAVVSDGKGGRATGTKSESAANFPDFGEKAETGAIGRALAVLGYGTQFAQELDEQDRIVDSPVEPSSSSVPPVPPPMSMAKPLSTPATAPASAPAPAPTPKPAVSIVPSTTPVATETAPDEVEKKIVGILGQLKIVIAAKMFLEREYGKGIVEVNMLTPEQKQEFANVCEDVRMYATWCYHGKGDPGFKHLTSKKDDGTALFPNITSILSLFRTHNLTDAQKADLALMKSDYNRYIVDNVKVDVLCTLYAQEALVGIVSRLNRLREACGMESLPYQVSTYVAKNKAA